MKPTRSYSYIFPKCDDAFKRFDFLSLFLLHRIQFDPVDTISNGKLTIKLNDAQTINAKEFLPSESFELCIAVVAPLTLDEDSYILKIIDGEI